MGYFANRLKKRLESMTDEQFEQKMQEMEEDCNIGPEASEFIKEQENYINYMKEKEQTAQEIVERLIDELRISGKEAVILLNAINKPAEVRIEKEYVPYSPPITTPWYQTLDTGEPRCYEPGDTCTNPHMDCINCPKFHNNVTCTAATMKEE